jgi:ArsR family transcriptional regulator
MDSAELLDLLGNANRRRILRLLAHKPCYVTEISEYLGVSPKAVIDHLQKLDEAGLVESRTNDRRRKYFSIARNLRLEVQVSPHEFGAKSAYPANPGFDVSSCRYVSIEVDGEETTGEDALTGGPDDLEADAETLKQQARELERLKQLENELSLAQRWVQGCLSEVRENIDEAVENGTDDGRLYAAVIGALATGGRDVTAISRDVEAPPELVEEALEWLAAEGIVEEYGDGWRLRE